MFKQNTLKGKKLKIKKKRPIKLNFSSKSQTSARMFKACKLCIRLLLASFISPTPLRESIEFKFVAASLKIT